MDTFVLILQAIVQIFWWVVPVIILTALAAWISERAEKKACGEWPYKYDAPFNMDEDQP